MNIKDRIEEMAISIEEARDEDRLKKYLQTFEPWGTRWRLENLSCPETKVLRAFGKAEVRN